MDTEDKVEKYFNVLDALKFNENDDGSNQNAEDVQSDSNKRYLENNVTILQKAMPGDDINAIIKKAIRLMNAPWLEDEIQTHELILDEKNVELTYAVYLKCVLLELYQNINFNSEAKEDLISNRHIGKFITAVQELSVYALRRQLYPTFYEARVFANERHLATGCNSSNFWFLVLAIEGFEHFLKINQLHLANAMELVVRDYMAAIFTVCLENSLQEYPQLKEPTLRTLQSKLDYIWLRVSKVSYLRNIMLFKGLPKAPPVLQKQLHKELLQKLLSKDGFTSMVATLYTAQCVEGSKNSQHGGSASVGAPSPLSDKQVFEVIANIVAFRGHTQRAQSTLIRQIFKFLDTCLLNESAMIDCMGAGLLSLRRLFDASESNRREISEIIDKKFETITDPKDVITGLILMEHAELALLIATIYQLFCSSTVECLPSELLVPYQPLLLQMYHQMPERFLQKQQLASIIMRCLHNRNAAELEGIILKLYKQQTSNGTARELHPRIVIYPNAEQTQLTVKIASSNVCQDFSPSLALPEVLMAGQHHLLTYRIFMILLREMSKILMESDGSDASEGNVGLFQTEEELLAFLNAKYPVKVEILLTLNTLICHQPLKDQIGENAADFLRFLSTLLQQRLHMRTQAEVNTERTEVMDQTLLILLTITQELLEQTQIPETYRDLVPSLQQLRQQTPNQLVCERIKCLLTVLSGDFKANAARKTSDFSRARALVESKESHLQVYGMQSLLELLRQRDSVTLANAHVLIALALSSLKNRESYTFLNCVRLFVGLVHVMEAEVLETLADEYLNEHADRDYRLVVGEALLKVARELGALSYKYKDTLLNTFMHGARSPQNEFRMSSYSNLAQLTRILCYQVHTFFQELLNLIDCELSSGTYLPAKRAATLVLSELLAGIEDLLDFEEMLLPIYRVLKVIEADENADAKMRQHAANGLKVLAEKCKKFLFPETPRQKEICILGLNDDANTKRGNVKSHILELN